MRLQLLTGVNIHLSANTTTTFVLNVLRECNVMRSPVTSNYVFRFAQQGMNVVHSVVLSDLSSAPSNFQSFTIDVGAVGLAVGDHQYQVWNASGTTVNDIVGDVMLSGWATVHGSQTSSTDYHVGDGSPTIAYE